jgi:asparagine synthase (glutamine-hydrolysing)
MCGIAGLIDLRRQSSEESLCASAKAMADAIAHRGPDASGTWADPTHGIAFGHRRLSIVDLSEAGAQPMASHCGRMMISYNGEVYNAADLRTELEAAGRTFRGHSDTEVIVEACAEWGVARTLPRLNGMFALALWDCKEKTLTLVRDRMGIKPLYWAAFEGLVLFGSELRALRAHPGWTPKLNRDALASYLRHNCIPAPHTIYRGVQKLMPGRMVTFGPDGKVREETYWSMEDIATAGMADRLDISDDEAVAALEELLSDAVSKRMIADVPLGSFLSGGIDSSTITALMQAHSNKPVKTFTIGFDEKGYDESVHAKAVAQHLGTDHTELFVSASQALDVIPKLPSMYDEPFADSSQIPTFLLSEMTRKHVTVALSGDGGDELFAGYTRYFQTLKYGGTIAAMPRPLRNLGAAAINALPPAMWDGMFAMVPERHRPSLPSDKMKKIAGVLGGEGDSLYHHLISHWPEPNQIVKGANEPRGLVWDERQLAIVPDQVERMQYLDSQTYLPDDILTKVDRASMAVSLEARVPLLDHRMVEFSWRLPGQFKIRDGKGKWLLRQLLYKHVPANLIERPKTGFGIPLDSWLRGPLRDWGEDLLDEGNLRDQGIFDPAPIRRKWQEHLSGKRNWHYHLWDILMFQAWHAENPL